MPCMLHDNGEEDGEGLERLFYVCAPPDWWNQAGPSPVMMVFHPANNDIVEAYQGQRLHQLLMEPYQAGLEDDGLPAPKLVVVYVQAQGMLAGRNGEADGNYAYGAEPAWVAMVNPDDVGCTKAILDLVQARMSLAKRVVYGIEPEVGGEALDLSRVYLVGYSGGALLVHRLAVELITRFGLTPAAVVSTSGSAGGSGTEWEVVDDGLGQLVAPFRWFPREHGIPAGAGPHVLFMMGMEDFTIPGWAWSPPQPFQGIPWYQKLDPRNTGGADTDLNPNEELLNNPREFSKEMVFRRYRAEVSGRVWAEHYGANPAEPLDRRALAAIPGARLLQDGTPDLAPTPVVHWHYRTAPGPMVLCVFGPKADHGGPPRKDNAWGFDSAPFIWDFCTDPYRFVSGNW